MALKDIPLLLHIQETMKQPTKLVAMFPAAAEFVVLLEDTLLEEVVCEATPPMYLLAAAR
jgi:hypothetical protein